MSIRNHYSLVTELSHWIFKKTSRAHRSINASFLFHSYAVLQGEDIAITYHRDSAFGLFARELDALPVGRLGVLLMTSTPMHTNVGSACTNRCLH
jgi:hypothetical protein